MNFQAVFIVWFAFCKLVEKCVCMSAMSTHSLRVKWTVKLKTIRGFPSGTSGKEPTCNAGDVRDVGSIPGSERFPKAGHGNPLQYSCLENPWTEEPGRLQSVGSQRVRHDWRMHLVQAAMEGATQESQLVCRAGSGILFQGESLQQYNSGTWTGETHQAGQICHGLEAPDLVAAKYFLKQLNVSMVSKRKSSYKSHHTQGDPCLHV